MIDKQKFLDDLHEIARQNGGCCLSNEYINSSRKLLFKCKHGHQFESCRDYLKAGNWCPFCAGRGRSVQDLKELANKFGGQCLSEHFLGMDKKHLWKCAKGHQWEAMPSNIIKTSGTWCPICGRKKSDKNRRRHTIEDMYNLASVSGGVCLSTKFESVIKKLTWQCSEGHIWEADPHHVKNGTWCPVCSQKIRAEQHKTHTIEEMQIFATNKGGQCLSIIFANVKDNLLWACAEGHQWMANADNIINGGKWCPVCAGNQLKTIEDMQNIALKRGGKCLSTIYQGANKKLQWECQEGHQWETIPAVIFRGGWCPTCSAGLGERICREFFEQLLGESFKKARPNWLRTSRGHQMELDGYSQVLKIAFEHQGMQHYKSIKHFDSSKSNLFKIQENDRRKRGLCNANGITLIEVPSILEILGIDNVKTFISGELSKNNILVPPEFGNKEIDLNSVYCPNKLSKLQDIALEHGGILISKKYLGIFEHLEWECTEGHRFKAAPNNVKNSGSWCPKCIGRGRNIQDMCSIAVDRGGKCLSKEYVNSITPLLWQCQEGHQWNARPNNVLFGTWCPVCAKKNRWIKRRNSSVEDLEASNEISSRLPPSPLT
jgi:Probable Zinc-ribbon domain